MDDYDKIVLLALGCFTVGSCIYIPRTFVQRVRLVFNRTVGNSNFFFVTPPCIVTAAGSFLKSHWSSVIVRTVGLVS
jgi:hypothetical protein